MRRLLLLAALAAAAAGCDRVPIGSVETGVLVADLDLDVVFLQPDLVLRLVPDGPGSALTLRIRDKEIEFDPAEGAFVYEKTLDLGLNAYPLSVTSPDGEVQRDTLYAVYLPLRREALAGATLGEARADAAVAPLGTGESLVSGGVDASGQALASAVRLRSAGAQVVGEDVALGFARSGHTATPAVGGTLLMGGATVDVPDGAGDFVATPEWIGPNGAALAVEVLGDAGGPRRTDHVARGVVVDGETYVYLLGGRTATAAGTALSSTVDVYRVLRPETEAPPQLERLSPADGASGFVTLSGAAFAADGPFAGVAFGLADATNTAVRVLWTTPGTATYPLSLDVRPAAPLKTARTEAAAVALGGDLALVVGGRDASGEALGTLEVYATSIDRTFRFPPEVALEVPRSGHVATILSGGRIVVQGGRPSTGGPIVATEAFRL